MSQSTAVPAYLNETYWWAYVHPNAVRLFERQWLVNLILWGNFAKLRKFRLKIFHLFRDRRRILHATFIRLLRVERL